MRKSETFLQIREIHSLDVPASCVREESEERNEGDPEFREEMRLFEPSETSTGYSVGFPSH